MKIKLNNSQTSPAKALLKIKLNSQSTKPEVDPKNNPGIKKVINNKYV